LFFVLPYRQKPRSDESSGLPASLPNWFYLPVASIRYADRLNTSDSLIRVRIQLPQAVPKQPSPSNPSCPCGSSRSYSECCGRWHDGPQALQAPTAEALMRSRYSAFVLDNLPYLLATWHPRTRPASLDPNPPGLKWLGLQIKAAANQDAEHATVEFVARSRLDGRASRIHETSRFLRENGQWFYLDGDVR
jgi:SEC-C motif-containing protein